jgi:hypothetical protein
VPSSLVSFSPQTNIPPHRSLAITAIPSSSRLVTSVMTLFQSYHREKAIRERDLQTSRSDKRTRSSHSCSQLLLENMLPRSVHAKQLLLGELVFDELQY